MNIVDMVLLGILGLAAVLGWKLKSLILLGLGFVFTLAPLAAYWGGPALVPHLLEAGVSKSNAGPSASFIVLVASALIIFGIFRLLSKAFQALMLGWLDRGAGALMLSAGLFIFMIAASAWIQDLAHRSGAGKIAANSILVNKVFPAFNYWR